MRLIRSALDYARKVGRGLQVPREFVSGAGAQAESVIGVSQTSGVPVGSIGGITQNDHLPKAGPLAAYSQLVLEGKIREDGHQVTALNILQDVGSSVADVLVLAGVCCSVAMTSVFQTIIAATCT